MTLHRWNVAFKAGAWVNVEVEAETADEAADKADEVFSQPQLCHHCASNMDLSDWEPDDSQFGIDDLGPVG